MSVASGAVLRPAGRDAVAWYAYLLLGYFAFVISLQGSILPFLREALSLSYRDVSLHTSAIALGVILVGCFGDRVIRAVGRRRVLVGATIGSAASLVLLALAPAAVVSIGACFLFGIIGAFVPVTVQAVLADFEGRWRDIAIAEANAMACLFSTTAPLVTGLCVWIGLDWRMAIGAGVAAALIIPAAFRRVTIPEGTVTRETSRATLPAVYWCYWAALGLGVAVEFAAILWSPAYFETVLGLDPATAAMAGSAVFVGMLIGRAATAGLLRLFPSRHLFLAATLTVFVGFALYRGAGEPVLAIGGLFVLGLGIALLFPLTLSFAIDAAGPAAQKGSARVMIASGLAIMLGPPLLGSIADAAGLASALLMIPAFMALSLVAFAAGELSARRRSAATPMLPAP